VAIPFTTSSRKAEAGSSEVAIGRFIGFRGIITAPLPSRGLAAVTQ
jgi:hypothetical protein